MLQDTDLPASVGAITSWLEEAACRYTDASGVRHVRSLPGGRGMPGGRAAAG